MVVRQRLVQRTQPAYVRALESRAIRAAVAILAPVAKDAVGGLERPRRDGRIGDAAGGGEQRGVFRRAM